MEIANTLSSTNYAALIIWDDSSQTLPVTLSYDISDAFAVSLTLMHDHRAKHSKQMWIDAWLMSRDLLQETVMDCEAGSESSPGQIRLHPDKETTVIDLSGTTIGSGNPGPRIECQTEHLREFLDASFQVMPQGKEAHTFDWDEWASSLIFD